MFFTGKRKYKECVQGKRTWMASVLPWRCTRKTDFEGRVHVFSSLMCLLSKPRLNICPLVSLILIMTWDKCSFFFSLANPCAVNANRCVKNALNVNLLKVPQSENVHKHTLRNTQSIPVALYLPSWGKSTFIRQQTLKDTQGKTGHSTHTTTPHWHFPGFNGLLNAAFLLWDECHDLAQYER